MSGNPVEAYELVVAQLKDQLSLPDNAIRCAVSEEWALKNALAGSVNVIFFEEQPLVKSTPLRHGSEQMVELSFLIITTTRNVADAGVTALKEAVALRGSVFTALAGHLLSPDYTHLKQLPSGRRYTVRGEYVHYPQMLACHCTIK
jgi:hypothetical protein